MSVEIEKSDKNKKECCGCGACLAVCPVNCIQMVRDDEGFLYPKVDKSICINCGKCYDVCSFAMEHHAKDEGLFDTYGCEAIDERIRNSSSSGGVFTILAEAIVEQGGIVYGVALDSDCRRVLYSKAECKSAIVPLRGSKYVQAEMNSVYKDVEKDLKAGHIVLFSGTPCQINGLIYFLGKEYNNLYCIDVICHGVPSPRVWGMHIDYIEKKYGKRIADVCFRDKRCGWYGYGISYRFYDGTDCWIDKNDDIFMRLFLEDIILRPSCYDCRAKLRREADISLADFWRAEAVLGNEVDDKGTSLVIVRSLKGHQLLRLVSNKINCIKSTYEDAIQFNPSEYSSVKHPELREKYFKRNYTMSYEAIYDYIVEQRNKQIRKCERINRIKNIKLVDYASRIIRVIVKNIRS